MPHWQPKRRFALLWSLEVSTQTVAHARNNWTYIVQSNSEQIADEASIEYPVYKKSYRSQTASEENLEGVCRPGFLIIGQGKCGTSSL